MKSNKKINPPTWARRFFEWYCNDETVAEDLTGDMEELFHQNLETMSAFKARLKYCLQILVLIFSYAVRNRKKKYSARYSSNGLHSFAMYKSYTTLAFRNLARQKVFSFINMICLSVGMSVGLLALAVFIDVMEVDSFQKEAENIYRITTEVDDKNEKTTYASSSAPLAEQLKTTATGIKAVVQLEKNFNPEVIQSANTSIPFQGYYADKNFFEVFTFPLLEGNAKRALEKPFSVVLTESAAEKLFRKTSAIGKILEVKGLGNFEVTAVIKDYPRSHLLFEVLASYSTIALLEQQGKLEPSLQDWGPVTDHYTYLLLPENKNASEIASLLAKFTPAQFPKEPSVKATYELQPLTEIPTSDLSNEIGLGWGDLSLYIFFFLALLVLLPACFNYANIAVARALKRAKEIGLRKVSGGQSQHIFLQMVMETIVLSVISLTGAILIFVLVRNEFLGMVVRGSKTFDLEITPLTLVVFLLFGIVTGFLAGVFPAAYFARLNPIETLRNTSNAGKLSKISIRKGLIVTQFALSLIFILGVSIIFKQYRYALNYDMGFQKENVLDIPLKNVDDEILRTALEKLPEVTSVSMSSSIPGNWSVSGTWVPMKDQSDSLLVYQMYVDQHYIDNLELTILAGNGFAPEASEREEYIIVNETFLKKFNLGKPHYALNQSFQVDGEELRIIGVVKDFNYMPLREEIQSFFFRYNPKEFRYANVKLRSTDIQKTLERIEYSWNGVTDQKFEARFLEDELEAMLVSFKNMIRIFGFLGLLAITISCLGLLAVVISAAESRTKEMGIRKILGATISNLAISLSHGFIKLIAIAIMIATPITYFIFDKLFLQMQHYRAPVEFTEIALGIFLLLILVVVIIGSQIAKVARINPVDTLKQE
jgi:putative ABC transport system permease protein